jgi:Thioredoxin-like
MYPHERSLVKRLEDKPFALLGINSDRDRQELKETLKKEQITWRSWWDGGSTEGPIATQWNVSGWPTIYVIDHRGVIRGKQLRGPELDGLVDKLLKEMEAPGGNE